jgi:hypothetical protein
MSDFGLGIKTDLLCSQARDFVFPALHIHEKKMGLWEQMPILDTIGIGGLISRVLPLFNPKANQFAAWYQSFLDLAISTNTTQPAGIFGPMLQSGQGYLEKPGHNYANMIGDGALSTFSSADAYGILLSGFLHYLSYYPYVYEKLAIELRGKFRPGDNIAWTRELEACEYLRAVIDEVMRMLPPACGVHWRECERNDVTVGPDDVAVPVGSDVGMSLFTLFRDARIFRDPVKFWPERWLPGIIPNEEQRFARKMFVPFSVGPRNCAGGHVAIMMASVAFTYVLVNYDFRLGEEMRRGATAADVKSEDQRREAELVFESHYSIAGWESGPFVQFKRRA